MIDEIKNWLNNQHPWLQEAACRILSNTSLSETDISELSEIIKKQSKTEKKSRSFPIIKTLQGNKIKLISIGPIVGIDQLNSRKPLELGNENLSVVYGQNGSGKSGYVRILKSACGKSHNSQLKSNVYLPSPPKQTCIIKYSINDGQAQEIEWIANTQSINDLSVVDIFDAYNGSIYLENETEVSYLPPELAFFTKLVDVCGEVQKKFSDDEQKLISALPEIPENFNFSLWTEKYNNLRYNTTQSELDEMLSFSENDKNNVVLLKQRLSIDDPLAVAKKQKAIKEQIDGIRVIIEETLNAISQESLDDIRQKLQNSKQKRKNADEGAKAFTSNVRLDGIGNETWRALWEAARQYSITSAYIGKTFPNIETNARCPLCHQELDNDAKKRFQSFESFVQGNLELEAKEAETVFLSTINNFPECPTETILTSMCQAAGLDDITSKEISTVLFDVGIILKDIHEGKIPSDDLINIPDTDKLLKKMSTLSENTKKSMLQFEEDAKEFDRDKAQKELLELEAKQWISQQKRAIEAEINRLKEIEKHLEWKKYTETGKITREASTLSEKIITESYISRFNDELNKLNASTITVELVKTRGEKGRSKHRIRLKNLVGNDTMPIEILSDGEKRIVSLAAFLADVTAHNSNTPFVFDDPISSLDQEYEEKTIERLVELSRERQVVVFTHRLSFLGIIGDKAKKADINHNIVHMRREPWGTGNPGDVPIFGKDTKEALNKLKNDRLLIAKRIFESDGNEAYYPLGKAICSDFRIIIERIVESVLLSEVVLRYRRDIQTKNKLSNILKVSETDCKIIDDLMTKYSFYEHSQPPESPVFIPDPVALGTDLDTIIKWQEEFKKKMK